MTTDDLVKAGIAAIKSGQKESARRLLAQALEQDRGNATAWLWLSAAVDTDKDRLFCLQQVLAIDPENETARRGVERLQEDESTSSETFDLHTAWFERMINDLDPPTETTITPKSRRRFEIGMDKANSYRGHPDVLHEALRLFQQTGSLPLFYAGAAYVHVLGSYEEARTYRDAGLRAAQRWLDKAVELAPGATETLVVQTFIHTYCDEFDAALACLDQLHRVAPRDFNALMARLAYYMRKEDKNNVIATHEQTVPLANSATRRTHLLWSLGGYYLTSRTLDKSLRIYRDLTKLTPDDPWLWHNMSIIHLAQNQIVQAWRCNNKALQLMEFENAYRVRKRIRGAMQRAVIAIVAVAVFFLAQLWRYRDVIFGG